MSSALVLIDLMPRIIAMPLSPHSGDEVLQRHRVTTLVLGGLVTTMGVESTARAASDHGYDLEFIADAMSDLTADEHNFAVEKIFPRFGQVRNTADYMPNS